MRGSRFTPSARAWAAAMAASAFDPATGRSPQARTEGIDDLDALRRTVHRGSGCLDNSVHFWGSPREGCPDCGYPQASQRVVKPRRRLARNARRDDCPVAFDKRGPRAEGQSSSPAQEASPRSVCALISCCYRAPGMDVALCATEAHGAVARLQLTGKIAPVGGCGYTAQLCGGPLPTNTAAC